MEQYYINPSYDNHNYRDNRVVSLEQNFASLQALESSITANDDGYLLLSYLNQRRKDKKSRLMNQTSTLDKRVKLINSNDMSNLSDARSPNRRNTYNNNNYNQSRESKHQPPVYSYHEMLSDDDSDNEKDDDVSMQTLSLLEKILYERGQTNRNRNSRFSSPASSNVSTPVKKSNLALSEQQEIQFEKVFQLVDKREQAELDDIHTLRSLLRSALDEKIKYASVFADNKQLSEENIAFQLQIANLSHRMLTSKHKAHLPWSFWGIISIRYTYKTSKSFYQWRQVIYHESNEQRLSKSSCKRVISKWLRRYQQRGLTKWKEVHHYWKTKSVVAKKVIYGWLRKYQTKGFKKWLEFTAYHRRVTNLLGQGPLRTKAYIFKQWRSFARFSRSISATTKEGTRILLQIMTRRALLLLCKRFHKWVNFSANSEILALHASVKKEKFKYYLEKMLNIMRRFMKEAITIWKCEVFPEKYNHGIKVAKKVMLRWLRRFQKKALDKWSEYTSYHRRVTSYFSQAPTRMKVSVFRAFRLYINQSKIEKRSIVIQKEENARKVIIKWLRKYQKVALEKWKEFTSYHRRVTSFFGQGPKRVKCSMIRQWKRYVTEKKIMEKATLTAIAKRVILRWISKFLKNAFNKWMEFASSLQRAEMELIKAQKVMMSTLHSKEKFQVSRYFRKWIADVALWKQERFKAKSVILRWLRREQKAALDYWIMKTKLIKTIIKSTKQGIRALMAVVLRRTLFTKYKKFHRWCRITMEHKMKFDKLQMRTKNVIMKWLRNNLKAALDKWIDCIRWHRRVTKAFGLGPKRLLSDMFTSWRLYVKKSKSLTPNGKYVSAVLNSFLNRKALIGYCRYFFKWKTYYIEFNGRKQIAYLEHVKDRLEKALCIKKSIKTLKGVNSSLDHHHNHHLIHAHHGHHAHHTSGHHTNRNKSPDKGKDIVTYVANHKNEIMKGGKSLHKLDLLLN